MTDEKLDPDDELGDTDEAPDTTDEAVAALPEVRTDTVTDDPNVKEKDA